MCTAALVALALGAAFGRWQVIPARSAGPGVEYDRGALVMLEPVAALSLRGGDTIFLHTPEERGLRRVGDVVDSWERRYEIHTEEGDVMVVQLPSHVWRASRGVPYLGYLFTVLVGRLQGVLLVLAGIGLIVTAEIHRARLERALVHAAVPVASRAGARSKAANGSAQAPSRSRRRAVPRR